MSLQSPLKLFSAYLIVGVTVVLLVVGFAYAYGIYVAQVSPTPRPEGGTIPSPVVTPIAPGAPSEPEINWSEVRRLIREHPLANQLKLDRAVETPLYHYPRECIGYKYPESTWIVVDYRGSRALIHVDKVIFCTKYHAVSLSEIIAYPGFNLEDVPPEFNNIASKVVELVYERSRKLYGEPERVGLIAVVEEGPSRVAYAVAVVGKGRYGFTVDLTTNTVSEWFFAKGVYVKSLGFYMIAVSERE
ncbi:MAG: hypothetical protein LM578_01150 [Desulfurococcaceae archaeon]|nr:hypothetical protein [Desulfurococcaceae archaeon]